MEKSLGWACKKFGRSTKIHKHYLYWYPGKQSEKFCWKICKFYLPQIILIQDSYPIHVKYSQHSRSLTWNYFQLSALLLSTFMKMEKYLVYVNSFFQTRLVNPFLSDLENSKWSNQLQLNKIGLKKTLIEWILEHILNSFKGEVNSPMVTELLHVTNAWPERGASAVKRIKSRQRSKIKKCFWMHYYMYPLIFHLQIAPKQKS